VRLRFLCSSHPSWLETDGQATHSSWLRSYDRASVYFDTQENIKALHHAGCALETAELLIFTHGRNSAADIHRFTDSAALTSSLIYTG
jgi:hypothetical protein